MRECNGVFVGGVIKSLTNCFTVYWLRKVHGRWVWWVSGGVTLTFK